MLRFSIRDVLWLTALVAIAVGWWAADRVRSRENAILREGIAILIERYPPNEEQANREQVQQLAYLRRMKAKMKSARRKEELLIAIGDAEDCIQRLRQQMGQSD